MSRAPPGSLGKRPRARSTPIRACGPRSEIESSPLVTFDNEKVGVQQGTSLLQGLRLLDADRKKTDKKDKLNIELFAGSPDDNNARFFYKGAGNGFELDAIAAVFTGGLIMGVLNNGMSLLGLGSEVQSFIKGFVLLLAVASTSSTSGGQPTRPSR